MVPFTTDHECPKPPAPPKLSGDTCTKCGLKFYHCTRRDPEYCQCAPKAEVREWWMIFAIDTWKIFATKAALEFAARSCGMSVTEIDAEVVHVIEHSAYLALEAERDELKWHFDRIAKQVMPGENDTGETVLMMLKELEQVKAAHGALFKQHNEMHANFDAHGLKMLSELTAANERVRGLVEALEEIRNKPGFAFRISKEALLKYKGAKSGGEE